MICFKDFEGISSFHFLIVLTQVLLLSLHYSSGLMLSNLVGGGTAGI